MIIDYKTIDGQHRAGYYCYRHRSAKDQHTKGKVKKMQERARMARNESSDVWRRILLDAWNKGKQDAIEEDQ